MILRTALTSLAFATSVSVQAAPEWVALAETGTDSVFIDRTAIAAPGESVEVAVLRNFNETMTLGNDVETGKPWYPHRSVKVRYLVDCSANKLAVSGWQMFEGNFGNGDIVWAEQRYGKLNVTAASDDETRAVLRSTCATRTVSR